MAVTEYTEINSPNWFSRLGGSFKGIVRGFILVFVGIGLLFWNEGRAVKNAKAIEEGAGAVVSVSADKVDPANEGKLIHVNGMAQVKGALVDNALGVSVEAIKLNRKVEIYQWVENVDTEVVKKDGKQYEKKTYSYAKDWCDEPIDSSTFKEAGHDNNNAQMSLTNLELLAKDVTLGAFKLSESNIRRISSSTNYKFPEGYKVPETLKGGIFENGTVYISKKAIAPIVKEVVVTTTNQLSLATTNEVATATTNEVVNAPEQVLAYAPQIGDLRISLSVVMPQNITLCQKQVGDSFTAWKASNGKMISEQCGGILSAEEMFDKAASSNNMMTWILRVIGFIVLLCAFKAIFGPLVVLVDVIPILNGIVAMGVGLVAGLLAAVVWLVTVGIAWVFYRPVLGIMLLVAAGAICAFVISKKTKLPIVK